MNAVWDFGRWTLSEQWDFVLRLRFTPASTLVGLGLLIAGGAFIADCRRREGALSDRARLFGLGANLLSLLLLCWAGDSLTFYFAWFWLGLSSMVLNPRDSASDGVALSGWRWAPGMVSQVCLLVTVVLLQGMLRATDWLEMRHQAVAVGEPASLRVAVCLGASILAAWLPFFFLPARRENLWTGFQFWCRNVAAPLAGVVLLWRVSFLVSFHTRATAFFCGVLFVCGAAKALLPLLKPTHRYALTAFGVAVGAMLCGLCMAVRLENPWALRIGILSTSILIVAAIRLQSSVWKWNAPEDFASATGSGLGNAAARFWRSMDQNLWDGVWQVPVRIAHAVGGAFVYWQGNSAQYTLVVILLGTLLLFWAALKTQVIW